MNNQEFKTEAINYIESSFDNYCSYKDVLLEMFAVVHEICEKNQLRYYYAFGSLLGIIRDKGMIPWDADIDILIPINTAESFIHVLREKLPDDYYVVSNFIDRNYYLCESRICKNGYDPDIIHIDIFYLLGAPDQSEELEKFSAKVKKIFYLRALRYQKTQRGENSRDNLVHYAKKIIRCFMHLEPNVLFNWQCTHLLYKYNYLQSKYCVVWGAGAEIFPIRIFEPAKLYLDGDFKCYLPNDPETFLRIRYGDYMNYMPIQKRFDEFYSAYKRFNRSNI